MVPDRVSTFLLNRYVDTMYMNILNYIFVLAVDECFGIMTRQYLNIAPAPGGLVSIKISVAVMIMR